MRMVRCRRVLALCATAVVLLGACEDGESSAPPTTVPASTTTTLSQVELDKQKAQQIILTAADLPGFTEDPPDPDDESPELEAAANACVANNPLLVRLGEDDDPRGANSPDFSQGDELSVNSGVTFAENEEEARAAMAAATVSTFDTCFSNALAAELRKDPSFGNVTVTTARLPSLNAGDESVGYRSTARARVSGQTLAFYFDFTFFRVDRAVAVISAFGFDSPFPEADRSRLVTTMAGRMAA